MKRKLLALVFVLAFAITPFFAFGAHSAAAAGVDLTTPGTCVRIPANATVGAVTAFTNVTGAGAQPPLVFDFGDSTC